MIKKTLLVVLLCVIAIGLASTGLAQASSHVSVTRSISPSSVPAGGGEVTVEVEISGEYGIGSVEETLPAGFTYVDGSVMPSDITPERDGQKWSFPLVGETSFTYTVDTSSTAGPHRFSGTLTYGVGKTPVPVGCTSSVEVQQAQEPSVTVARSIQPDSVPAGGGVVTVEVEISGEYGIGSVEETLPAGFTYVDGSVMPSDITPERDGQKWSFPLVGETSFTYTVDTSSTAGPHRFSGTLTYGVDKTPVPVGGESSVTVRTPPPPPPRRPPPPVPAPNVEEMGEVTLWASATEALTMAPQVGDTITGAVMDPDDGVTGESWQWARTTTPAMMDSWMDIAGETNAAYTVTEGDTGYYLRVMATYTDAVGTDTAMEYSMPTMMVGAEAGDPLFGYDTSGNGRIDKDELAKAVLDYEVNRTLEKPALADLVFSYEIGL